MGTRRKFRVRWFRLVVILILGYCAYVFIGQQIELRAVNHEAEATRARLEQLKQLNKSLTEEKERLNTPAYVEKLARDDLGLVKPGEVPYIPGEKVNQ
jgi:cell division protein FtsL